MHRRAGWLLGRIARSHATHVAAADRNGVGPVRDRAHMARLIERDVKFDIGGDRQRIQDIDTSVKDVTFKHILLPVWLATYKYRGRSFRFVVNGRTGRVQGERPYSAWKIFFAVLLGLIIAGTVGYLYGLEQGAF